MTPGQMVRELIFDEGMTEEELSLATKTGQSTIHRIKSGFVTDPRYSTGKAIELIYKKVKGDGDE